MGIQLPFRDRSRLGLPAPSQTADSGRLVLRDTRVRRLRHDGKRLPLGHHRHDPSPHRRAECRGGTSRYCRRDSARYELLVELHYRYYQFFANMLDCHRLHVRRLPFHARAVGYRTGARWI